MLRRLIGYLTGRTETMLRVKRTKTAPSKTDAPGVTSVHYAASVTSRGFIETWHTNHSLAVAITDGVARRVKDFYRLKKNAGELTFEPVSATAAQLAAAVAADDAVGAQEFTTLQDEVKRLSAERDEAARTCIEAVQRAETLVVAERAAVARAESLASELAARSDEAATLSAQVHDLQAELAVALDSKGKAKK